MKRAITSIAVLLLLSMFIYCPITSAADTFEVSADNANAKIIEGDRYLIPVNLYGNSGIMGFRVMLSYDSRKVSLLSISRGFITAKGNFAANISVNDGAADILWNDTADVMTESGSLFFITVEKLSDNLSIDISFSQPDTFNERYEDIGLNCKTITIKDDVQTRIEDEKLARLGETVQRQNIEISSDAGTVVEDSSEFNYGSRSNITSEQEAEKDALKDYVKAKEVEENNISESEGGFKNGKVPASKKKKEYKTILDIPQYNKSFFVVFGGVIVLVAVGLFCKKCLMKDTEGKNEEKK